MWGTELDWSFPHSGSLVADPGPDQRPGPGLGLLLHELLDFYGTLSTHNGKVAWMPP